MNSGLLKNLVVIIVLGLSLVFTALIGLNFLPSANIIPNQIPNAIDLAFDQRWFFDANLDKSNYSLNENIVVTVNFTCIKTHILNNYSINYQEGNFLPQFSIQNSFQTLFWRPEVIYSPSHTYNTYTMQEGVNKGGTWSFWINPELMPPICNNSCIPTLSTGEYIFGIGIPENILVDTDLISVIEICFSIK